MTNTGSNLVRVGKITKAKSPNGRVTGFQIEAWHIGLNSHQVLRDQDKRVLESKVESLQQRWATEFEKQRQREHREASRKVEQREKLREREAREARRQELEAKQHTSIETAERATAEAERALQACQEILRQAIGVNYDSIWVAGKRPLSDKPMVRTAKGTKGIIYDGTTGKPVRYQKAFLPSSGPPVYEAPDLNFWDNLSSGSRARKESLAQEAFQNAKEKWQEEVDRVNRHNSELQRTLDSEKADWKTVEAKYKRELNEPAETANAEVDAFRQKYRRWRGEATDVIERHARLVLNTSKYADWMSIDFDLGYNYETRTIIVNYRLPQEASIPTLQSVTYVKSRDKLQQKSTSKREHEQLYDSVLHQIALRTIHELYSADVVKAFDAVVFNGWVEGVNPATGRSSNSYILSVQAQREEFLAIDLKAVEPRACFRALKGVSAAKLATLTPVRPVLQLNTNDRRFVQSRDVTQDLSGESNLATMDWEDFEHLVREIFEKEFVSEGGEVRVTQASRDGGVDAIAFDPDPIRGGKYVIQAKRYTRTVGVDAVRDLFGTVTHEGANRGILVTTSDYGPDSVSFAKDKPLTLINGSELLALLDKHGHAARIDLNEAREMRNDGSS